MELSRRRLFVGSAATLLVGGFDPVTRLWTSVAQADCDDRDRRRVRIPRLDGELVFDAASLATGAQDFGYVVSNTPWAVLRPASYRDVVAMVRFANRYDLQIAMRGQAHSTLGQAQVAGGIVIDSRTLDAIHEIGPGGAVVDAGVVWRDLLLETTSVGLTPRVMTDYLGLSIGGVLSVGGVGGAAHKVGLVVDQCLELTVVTGEGELEVCSATRNATLFRSVLGGLGQFAIIVGAKIRLQPAFQLARLYQMTFFDLATFSTAMRTMVADERFDFNEALAVPAGPGGSFVFILQALKWFNPGSPPNDAALLAGLPATPVPVEIQDLPYTAWCLRVDQNVAGWQAAGVWTTPHPWFDMFLPDNQVNTVVGNALAGLSPADLGAGVVILYAFKRSRLTRPMVRMPPGGGDIIWLFDILRFGATTPALAEAAIVSNRTLHNIGVAAGGKRYPISAVRVNPSDWIAHYGGSYPAVLHAKCEYDPRNVLTPGQRIFTR
jgi:cytokinin dehydrogenase